MKITFIATAALVLMSTTAAAAQTAPAPSVVLSTAKPFYTTEESTVGDLLDNPATQAILAKHVPELTKSEQIGQARGLTLGALKEYVPDILTAEKLKAIDAELAPIPALKK